MVPGAAAAGMSIRVGGWFGAGAGPAPAGTAGGTGPEVVAGSNRYWPHPVQNAVAAGLFVPQFRQMVSTLATPSESRSESHYNCGMWDQISPSRTA